MPTTIRQYTAKGLKHVDYTAESLADAVHHEPDEGVYTVANTVNTYDVLKLTAHLTRLQDSAKRENINLTLPHTEIRSALRGVIDIAGYGDVKFRITVPCDNPNEPIITVEPFTGYPASIYTDGLRLITVPNSARNNPAAKSTEWLHDREKLLANLPQNISDILLTDADGHLLECTSSNFYAVLNDTLYTALDGVLGGTSRQIIFDVASDVLPLVRRPVSISDLADLQEAFITSSSRGVVPVVEIDGVIFGDGKPGQYTQKIRQAYLNWVTDHLETL